MRFLFLWGLLACDPIKEGVTSPPYTTKTKAETKTNVVSTPVKTEDFGTEHESRSYNCTL